MIKNLLDPILYYKFLLYQLISRDIKGRYKQSFIGYTWIILNPLLQLIVYSFVFSIILRSNPGNIPYPIFLLIGLLPWIYFQSSLNACTQVLVDSVNLLRKVYFPREILIYAVICSKLVDLLISSIILLVLIFLNRIPISVSILFILPIFIIQVLLMAGLSLMLSAFNLFYRDIQYLVSLILTLLMYLTPIVYPIYLVPSKYLQFYKLNPLVGIIEGYRSAILNKTFDLSGIAESLIVALLVYSVGFFIFKRSERTFGDIA